MRAIRGSIVPCLLIVSFVAPTASAADADQSTPGHTKPAQTAIERSYLVCPAENRSENRALYWLGEALAEAMETALARAGADVVPRDDRRSIESELGIGLLSTPTIATRLKEAEELSVTRLVLTSFTTKGSRSGASGRPGEPATVITVSLRVLLVDDSRRGAVRTVGPLPLSDLPRLQQEVASALLEAEIIRRPGNAPLRSPASEGTPAAYEARVKSFLEEDDQKRVLLLRRAVEADPDYLRARLELASLLRDQEMNDKALATLNERPIKGDANLAAEAERLAGEIYLETGQPTPAVDALRRSLRWNDDASTHLDLARALAARGDLKVAAAELELARRLDPNDPEIREVRALLQTSAGTKDAVSGAEGDKKP